MPAGSPVLDLEQHLLPESTRAPRKASRRHRRTSTPDGPKGSLHHLLRNPGLLAEYRLCASVALTAGSRLGPYEILGQIGAGGMGEVYRAKDPRLGREVAIKVLPASFSQDADRLRRFEQEAKAAGVLNHPNITAVYDIGTHDDAPLRRPGAARGRDAALGARRRAARAAQGDRLRHPDRRTASPPRTRRGSSTGT